MNEDLVKFAFKAGYGFAMEKHAGRIAGALDSVGSFLAHRSPVKLSITPGGPWDKDPLSLFSIKAQVGGHVPGVDNNIFSYKLRQSHAESPGVNQSFNLGSTVSQIRDMFSD